MVNSTGPGPSYTSVPCGGRNVATGSPGSIMAGVSNMTMRSRPFHMSWWWSRPPAPASVRFVSLNAAIMVQSPKHVALDARAFVTDAPPSPPPFPPKHPARTIADTRTPPTRRLPAAIGPIDRFGLLKPSRDTLVREASGEARERREPVGERRGARERAPQVRAAPEPARELLRLLADLHGVDAHRLGHARVLREVLIAIL